MSACNVISSEEPEDDINTGLLQNNCYSGGPGENRPLSTNPLIACIE